MGREPGGDNFRARNPPSSACGRTSQPQTVKPVQLNPSTVEAFEAYIRGAEAGMEQTLQGNGPFLWCDVSSERTQRVLQGKIVAQRWSGKEPVKVPDGLIHS